jgi:predicted TIM-barrel fold metal-dependent hydrolase
MAATDVATFVGPYPYRHLDQVATPDWLLFQMDRLGLARAWVGYLPSLLHKDPAPGNAALEELVAPHRDRLLPTPTLHPDRPRFEDDLNAAIAMGASAVRLFPQYQGLDPSGGEMRVAIAALAMAGLPAVLTVRLEDARQRHPADGAPELPAAAARALVRSDAEVRLLVTHADRAFVEEVHFGLTPDEARRVLWDISWLWGPPEDHLAILLETVGFERFTLGTGMPLRIPDAAVAKLDLLDLPDAARESIMGGNLQRWRVRVG